MRFHLRLLQGSELVIVCVYLYVDDMLQVTSANVGLGEASLVLTMMSIRDRNKTLQVSQKDYTPPILAHMTVRCGASRTLTSRALTQHIVRLPTEGGFPFLISNGERRCETAPIIS